MPSETTPADASATPAKRWWWRCESCGRTFIDQSVFHPAAHDAMRFHMRPGDFEAAVPCVTTTFAKVQEIL